ncbi:hypothetical protein [Bradyrhizobium ottawaense]|uniref:hypothetical protein n=1 Tax=Bradyrhizobium ottawaense TaxID=931866 RepID=UPI0038502E86
MDHEELAARAAVACWNGSEGRNAAAIRDANPLDSASLTDFLNAWILARANPYSRRPALLAFLNSYAMPVLRAIKQPSDQAYLLIESLSRLAVAEQATRGRPTSMLSKLGHAVSPSVFVPYDSRVQKALRAAGKGVRAHNYSDYMQAVLSEKPAFDQELRRRGLGADNLKAAGMTQSLFEMRALDKWLMLRGGFNASRMERDIRMAGSA